MFRREIFEKRILLKLKFRREYEIRSLRLGIDKGIVINIRYFFKILNLNRFSN